MQKLLVLLPSIEGFLSLCELDMNLSSHQIIVTWRERSSSDMPVTLILIFFKFIIKISFDLLYNSELGSLEDP